MFQCSSVNCHAVSQIHCNQGHALLLCLHSYRFKVEEGKLYYKTRKDLWVEVIFSRAQRAHIMKSCHSDATAGHLGRNKTFYKISERYYWPGIFKDVTNAVSKTFPFSNCTIIITYYCMYTHVHTGCHMWAVSTYQHSYIWQGFSRASPHQSPIAMVSYWDRSNRPLAENPEWTPIHPDPVRLLYQMGWSSWA